MKLSKPILLTIILSILVLIVTLAIIFSPTGIAKIILDYSGVLAGLFFIVEATVNIVINRRQAFVFHITRILRIVIGLAMIAIHGLRILPVPTLELLGLG